MLGFRNCYTITKVNRMCYVLRGGERGRGRAKEDCFSAGPETRFSNWTIFSDGGGRSNRI